MLKIAIPRKLHGPMTSELTAKHLSLDYTDRPVFNDVNFTLCSGQALHIKGPNGSGKTSLLHIITQQRNPCGGELLWNNVTVDKSDDYSKQLRFVGHHHGLKCHLSVWENICLDASYHGRFSNTRAFDTIEKLNLSDHFDSPISELSAGQQRRVAFARLKIHTVKLWVLDEPFTALDQHGRLLLSTWMNQHIDAGGMIIFTSHFLPPSLDQVDTLYLGEVEPV